jgi:Kef-type K+ transport system membrane component KefB/nucleotide-binding universal stress UspA family protein
MIFGASVTKRLFILPAIAMIACGSLAFAADTGHTAGTGLGGSGETILIAEIALLLIVGRGLGEIMQRFGQPAVIGQLLAGIILGPSLFGWVWPQAHALIFPASAEQKNLIAGLANVGVMMLLLLTGMETDLKLVRKVGMPAFAVTAAGVAVPFLCGFALGQFLPDSILPAQHRLVASLFLGTALSISSIKIVAMVVREMNFMRRNLGQIIVASSIMEDTTGWIIVSIILGIAGAGGVSFVNLAKTILGTVLFLGLSYTIGRKLVFWSIRWVNDTFKSEFAVVTAILIIMCLMALITQSIGVNTVLGAFVAGVLVGESPILSKQIENQLRGFIAAFMMPIFFGLSGLSANLTILTDVHLAILTVGLVAIASLGKFGGAFTGGLISGLSARESLALGCGLNARGSTEVIVASIGLGMGALTQNLYTMIVTMAVITTMAMPPMLRAALRRLPISEEEEKRLEREDLDARGFVSRFERLLIAADNSANGELATRLAGFIAGRRGIPVTMLPSYTQSPNENEPLLEDFATDGAKKGHRVEADKEDEEKPEKVEVSVRAIGAPHEGVADEAAKGYDILFVGLEKMIDKDGFSATVDRVAAKFEGPLALVVAGNNAEDVAGSGFDILVPVNGTEAARRGAEMAFALTSLKDSDIVALHVADRAPENTDRRAKARRPRRKAERAILEDVSLLARHYGYEKIRTVVHTDVVPPVAILEEAQRSKCNMIVLGTSRRVGEHLSLGQTAGSLLEKWKGAIIFVVT